MEPNIEGQQTQDHGCYGFYGCFLFRWLLCCQSWRVFFLQNFCEELYLSNCWPLMVKTNMTNVIWHILLDGMAAYIYIYISWTTHANLDQSPDKARVENNTEKADLWFHVHIVHLQWHGVALMSFTQCQQSQPYRPIKLRQAQRQFIGWFQELSSAKL